MGSLWVVSNVCRRAGMEFFFPGVPCCTGVGMCTDLDSMSVVCVKDNRMR